MKFFRWKQRRDEDLNDEIQNHLDAAIRDRMGRGETAEQAAANARREFGNIGLVKEVTREMWGWASLERLMRDLRYGMRMLLKHKGITVVAVLSLALGIGANTAIFSLIDAVLLKMLPVERPEELYFIQNVGPHRPGGGAPPYPCSMKGEVKKKLLLPWRSEFLLTASLALLPPIGVLSPTPDCPSNSCPGLCAGSASRC